MVLWLLNHITVAQSNQLYSITAGELGDRISSGARRNEFEFPMMKGVAHGQAPGWQNSVLQNFLQN